MKKTTTKPYSSFLHTTSGMLRTTATSSPPATKKDIETKKDNEEEEVYILYGVLFNNGSDPVIASNITDNQVVEEVRSRLALLARDGDQNSQEENKTALEKNKKKFGNGARSGNGVGEIVVGKRRKEELIMSRVDHDVNKPSTPPTYYPVKLEKSSKVKIVPPATQPHSHTQPPATQPLKLGNSPRRPEDSVGEGMPVKHSVRLGNLVKQLLKYPVKPRTNQAVELPPLTEQLFNLSKSVDHPGIDEHPSNEGITAKQDNTDEKLNTKYFQKQEIMNESGIGNNDLQKKRKVVSTDNAVHSLNLFSYEVAPDGRGSNNPEFAEKITKAIFPPNLSVPTRGSSVIEGMSRPKLNANVRSNQKMDSGENVKTDKSSVPKKGFLDKSDQNSDIILVYPVSEKPVYFRPRVSSSKFVEIQPVYIGPHGAAVHGKYQFEESDAKGTTPNPATTKPQDSFDEPFLETDTWEVVRASGNLFSNLLSRSTGILSTAHGTTSTRRQVR